MYPIDIHTHNKEAHHRHILDIPALLFNSPVGDYHSLSAHPMNLSSENEAALIDRIATLSHHQTIVAIGEVGLDKRSEYPLDRQIRLVADMNRIAEECKKPLIIHCVKAHNELIVLKRTLKSTAKWIIHGFRGNSTVAELLIKEGFYLSYGRYFSEEALRSTPQDRLLAETDATNLPIDTVIASLAAATKCDVEQLSASISKNVRELFYIQ